MKRQGWLWLVALALQWVVPAHAHDTVYYYYTNTLHSAVVETDAQGNIVEQTTYYAPYGQVLNRSLRDGPGYTGHEEDPATGLNYMQQRYYDPQSGRFVSTDPVLPTDDGEDFNRYEYADDNPYRYTDPDGECSSPSSGTKPNSEEENETPCPPPPPAPKPKTLPRINVIGHAIPVVPIEFPEVAPLFFNPATAVFLIGISIPGNMGAAPCEMGSVPCGMMSSAQDRPPPNSKPIDQTPWSGDHGKIKGDLGLGGKAVVVIDPSGNVWVQHPDGSWSNEGPAGNFTGSGNPSGRRGKDRDEH